MNFVCGDAGLAKTAESSAKVAALDGAGRGCGLIELQREAAAFAVVGLGEVDELEVEAEGAGELVGGGEVEGVDTGERLLQMRGGVGLVRRAALRCFSLAAGDGGAAKCLDGFVERVAGLFAENLAEEHTERSDIAAQGGFFELTGRGLKLGEALGPVGWRPQGRHVLIMP